MKKDSSSRDTTGYYILATLSNLSFLIWWWTAIDEEERRRERTLPPPPPPERTARCTSPRSGYQSSVGWFGPRLLDLIRPRYLLPFLPTVPPHRRHVFRSFGERLL